jgi:hypothetical protein
MEKVKPTSKIVCLFAKNQMTENIQHMAVINGFRNIE